MQGMLSILLVCMGFIQLSLAATDKVVCYHGTWSVYRNGNGKFEIENIDPFKCTHIIYAFVGINTDGTVRLLDSYLDIDLKGFQRFNDLKKKNPALKTLLAIGGWNEGSTTFSQVAANKELRNVFVQNAAQLVQQHGFDGFDLDWEYPGQRGGSPQDKENFVLLLQEFRPVFDERGLLLTAAVAAAAASVDISYDVPALSKYLDFINVMAYDLHGSWDGKTGINAPLYPSASETGAARELNVATCIQGWIDRGAAPEKLILGIGTYGRTFTLNDPNNNGLGAPANAPGQGGPYTQESGMLGYNEICESQLQNKWNVVWDDEQMVPYAYLGNQWVGYDDPTSINLKVEFAKEKNLGGVMIWSIETDDFRGSCGSKYPLLAAINSGLSLQPPEESSSTTSKPLPTSSESPTTTSTAAPEPTHECTKQGYYRDPDDCSVFYYCVPFGDDFRRYSFKCSKGLVFNTETNNCDYPSNVQC